MDHPLTRAATACRTYNRFKALAEKSAISLTECFTARGKSPWMAILGAIRQDAAWLRLVRLKVSMRILLVKSDFEDET
ncbi:MAG: hypothetical protein K2G39_02045, partial [Lachnospiraceae bacterium]|nr:hypothetical protein [Lachnospiraceae bacterium]